MKLFDWYKRWRHGRGYGVHSPSAYALVRDVLRPGSKYAFYAYDKLKLRRWGGSMTVAEQELVYRLFVHFQPSEITVYLPEGADGCLQKIAAIALPEARVRTVPAERLSVVTPEFEYYPDPADPRLAQHWDALAQGHLFRNPHRALLVPNPKLPKQIFEVKY